MRVTIQSVLYCNEPRLILRAAEAAFNAAIQAKASGRLLEWEYRLGDCSPSPVFQDEGLDVLRRSAREAGGGFSYEHFGKNLGSAEGHNALAASSATDLIVFLNPDARPAPDCLDALIRSMKSGVGIVEARQVPLDHPKNYEEYTGDTSWASTACALTSRDIFNEAGGFDARSFFLYGDDVDYSWRVRLAGHRVVFEPAARVFHDKRLSSTADWIPTPAEQYYSAEAGLMLAHKYSRPDRVESLLRQFSASKVSALERAARRFRQLEVEGKLPDPIDGEHSVGQFVGDVYAEHRF